MYKLMREKKYEQRGLKSPNMKLEERLKRGAAKPERTYARAI